MKENYIYLLGEKHKIISLAEPHVNADSVSGKAFVLTPSENADIAAELVGGSCDACECVLVSAAFLKKKRGLPLGEISVSTGGIVYTADCNKSDEITVKMPICKSKLSLSSVELLGSDKKAYLSDKAMFIICESVSALSTNALLAAGELTASAERLVLFFEHGESDRLFLRFPCGVGHSGISRLSAALCLALHLGAGELTCMMPSEAYVSELILKHSPYSSGESEITFLLGSAFEKSS